MSEQDAEVGGTVTTLRRSHGGGFLALGYGAVAFAVFLIAWQWGSPPVNAYGSVDWIPMAAASGLLSIGLFLIAAGSIIRALWFLPGAAEKTVVVKRRSFRQS